jgi:hypothetical protein
VIAPNSMEILHEFNNPKFNGKSKFSKNLVLSIILIMYCPYIVSIYVHIFVSIFEYIYISTWNDHIPDILQPKRLDYKKP